MRRNRVSAAPRGDLPNAMMLLRHFQDFDFIAHPDPASHGDEMFSQGLEDVERNKRLFVGVSGTYMARYMTRPRRFHSTCTSRFFSYIHYLCMACYNLDARFLEPAPRNVWS
ncbi:unnamed protein product [Ectocarpus sp. 13 AM-2016]